MKFLVGLCLVLVCAVYVQCEPCTVNSDCKSVTCTSVHHVICEHKNEDGVTTNDGLCTCAWDGVAHCDDRDDCNGMDCDNDRHHCFDHKCVCSGFHHFGGAPSNNV